MKDTAHIRLRGLCDIQHHILSGDFSGSDIHIHSDSKSSRERAKGIHYTVYIYNIEEEDRTSVRGRSRPFNN